MKTLKTLTLIFILSISTFGQDAVIRLLLYGDDGITVPSGQELFRLADSTTYLKTNDGEVFTVDNPLISYLEINNEKNNYALLVDDRIRFKSDLLSVNKQRD